MKKKLLILMLSLGLFSCQSNMNSDDDGTIENPGNPENPNNDPFVTFPDLSKFEGGIITSIKGETNGSSNKLKKVYTIQYNTKDAYVSSIRYFNYKPSGELEWELVQSSLEGQALLDVYSLNQNSLPEVNRTLGVGFDFKTKTFSRIDLKSYYFLSKDSNTAVSLTNGDPWSNSENYSRMYVDTYGVSGPRIPLRKLKFDAAYEWTGSYRFPEPDNGSYLFDVANDFGDRSTGFISVGNDFEYETWDITNPFMVFAMNKFKEKYPGREVPKQIIFKNYIHSRNREQPLHRVVKKDSKGRVTSVTSFDGTIGSPSAVPGESKIYIYE